MDARGRGEENGIIDNQLADASRTSTDPLPTMIVCQVETPEGMQCYATCLSEHDVAKRGLPPEAVVGVVQRTPQPGERITPSEFARNRLFVDFMHEVIGRRGPLLPGLIAEARYQEDGWIYVIDQRTPKPHGPIPAEDIIGVFAVKGGEIVPNSYQPCPKHQILSWSGFVCLVPRLQACLMEELERLE